MNSDATNVINWHPGEHVVTRDGAVAIVTGYDARGNVLGVVPFASWPRVIRPVCDSWGGEHDCSMANAA